MKREALSSPKLLSLAGHLGIGRAQAIGHLTLLWDFTAEHATGGNVGKWDDETIARASDWQGEATTFIQALVTAQWVDECDTYRLVIHDWAEHCENWVRAKAQRSKTPLLRRGLKSGTYEVLKSDSYDADFARAAEPNQTNPNLPKPARACADVSNGQRPVDSGEPLAFTRFFGGYPRQIDRDGALSEWWALSPDNRLVAEIAAGLKRLKATEEWKRDGGRFVPSPKNFLKNRRWKDQPAGTPTEKPFVPTPLGDD